MKRSKPKHDTRPRWNDELTIIYRGHEYTAEQWQKMCQKAIDTDRTPHYKNDKTYNLKLPHKGK